MVYFILFSSFLRTISFLFSSLLCILFCFLFLSCTLCSSYLLVILPLFPFCFSFSSAICLPINLFIFICFHLSLYLPIYNISFPWWSPFHPSLFLILSKKSLYPPPPLSPLIPFASVYFFFLSPFHSLFPLIHFPTPFFPSFYYPSRTLPSLPYPPFPPLSPTS